MSVKVSPQGQSLAFGTAGPLLTPAGQMTDATFLTSVKKANLGARFPQTTRWAPPGSYALHPLDFITIGGVDLPLAQMPRGGDELDVSHRKAPGSNHATLVSHGKKTSPIQIRLRLFRDESLGYREGVLVGTDWWLEWDRIEPFLIAKSLSKQNAVPVRYPTLTRRGCDAIVFTKVEDPQHEKGLFFTVDLEGYDVRTVHSGDGKSKKVTREDIATRANPVPAKVVASPASKKRGK